MDAPRSLAELRQRVAAGDRTELVFLGALLLLASCGGSSTTTDVVVPSPAAATATATTLSRFGFAQTPATPIFEQAAAISLALLRGEDVAAQTGPMKIGATPATKVPPALREVEAGAIELGYADWRAEMRARTRRPASPDGGVPPMLVGIEGWAFLTRRGLLVEAEGSRGTDLSFTAHVPPALVAFSGELSTRFGRHAAADLAIPDGTMALLGDYAPVVAASRTRVRLEAGDRAGDEEGYRTAAVLLATYPDYASVKLQSIGVTVRGADGVLYSVDLGLDQNPRDLVVGTRWDKLAIIEPVTVGSDE